MVDQPGSWCNSRYITPRDHLLQKSLGYFLQHGVANLSLRPLAAATGTSARMLVHHFGSKEELIAAVMEQVRTDLQSSFSSLPRELSGRAAAEMMSAFWRALTARKQRPYLRLLLEVQILAIQNPARYRRYLTQTSSSWLRLIEAALPTGKRRRATATLFAAVIDGLLIELLSTGDSRRSSDALSLFVAQLSQHPYLPARRPKPKGKRKP